MHLRLILLFAVSFATTFLVRWPGFVFEYYCWDEHDYIAHNIYTKTQVDNFEVSFSNKWPLGHFLIYWLTYFSDPFSISSYRFATAFIDALTSCILAYTIWRFAAVNYRWAVVAACLASVTISVCLRSSLGIIAENIANLFLVGGLSAMVLSRGAIRAHMVALLLFSLACWVKPTAVFPAVGILAGYAIVAWRSGELPLVRLYQWCATGFVLIGCSLSVFAFDLYNIRKYFLTSAILYNFSSSHFAPSELSEKLDVIKVGAAFFQFTFPLVGLYTYAVFAAPKRYMCIINSYAAGALLSLLVRPAGAQTVYWLYLLPPMIAGALVGLRLVLINSKDSAIAILVAATSVTASFYGWAQNVYGQARGLYFGGGSGLHIEQRQITQIMPIVEVLRGDPDFRPHSSKLFLWGMPWQLFYLSKSVPSASLLTNETYKHGVNTDEIEELALSGLREADYAVIESRDVKMFPALKEDFVFRRTVREFSVFARQ